MPPSHRDRSSHEFVESRDLRTFTKFEHRGKLNPPTQAIAMAGAKTR
jgi:hypothetical protein